MGNDGALHLAHKKGWWLMFFARRKVLSLVCLALFVAGTNACTVDQGVEQASIIDETMQAEVYADAEGVLHFASHVAFYESIDVVGNMSMADLDAWEQSLGFVSYRRSFEMAMAQVIAAQSPEEADAILAEHDDIIETVGEEANPRIEALGYSAVINRQGLFYVGGVLHKVLPELVISAEDGRIETINDAMAKMGELGLALVTSISTPLPGVRVVRYAGDSLAQLKGSNLGCTDNKTAWEYNSSNDRKVEFKISTWKYYCATCCGNYYHQVKAEARLWGYKKNLFGNWTSYKTAYECQNVEAVIWAPKVLGYNGTSSVFIYEPVTVRKTWNGSGSDYESWTCGSWNVGNQVQNSDINEPYLEKVKGQGKSRGTGTGNWAEICCGYTGGCSFPAPCVPRTSCYYGECDYVSDGCGGTLYCGQCSLCPSTYDECEDGSCCPPGKCGSGSSQCMML